MADTLNIGGRSIFDDGESYVRVGNWIIQSTVANVMLNEINKLSLYVLKSK